MKKSFLGTTFLALLAAASLAGCSSSSNETTADTAAETAEESTAEAKEADGDLEKLVVGASPAPHAEILEAARDLLADKGYDLEIVKLDWDSLVPAVQSGQVDCVIAGQSITKERQQMVDFTDPYYYASIITLVKNDGDYKDAASVEDLKGATVTSQQNTIWYDSCLPQIPDADILPAQESAPAMLVALESGKCDAVVTDMPTGKAACVAYPDFKLLDFSGTDGAFEVSDEDINIGISVQRGNDELKDAINGVLKDMTEDDYNKMMDEAISVQPLSES